MVLKDFDSLQAHGLISNAWNTKVFELSSWDEFIDQFRNAGIGRAVCDHEWVSSVAYKGARVCAKCGVYR